MSPNEVKQLMDVALNAYAYGSVVYGTYQPGVSDIDYLMVIPDEFHAYDGTQTRGEMQYTFYCASTWQKMLLNHEVCAVESFFLPPEHIIFESVSYDMQIDVAKLRASFSGTASNSWVKCKKKLTVPEDFAPRIGKKSLWHALRILDFGTQILRHGQIVNFQSMNYLHDEIVNNPCDDWTFYKEKYQPLYNKLRSEFRLAERECGTPQR